ncbi:MAG TPA: hypothetical protein VFN29_02265 [Chiayiivirga sp.]|nr:hypothetical protein [Chiayiivirga sp.]
MNTWTSFGIGRAVSEALACALQWRVGLIWIVTLGLVSLLGVAPLASALGSALDQVPDAARLAQRLSLPEIGGLMSHLGESGGSISMALMASLIAAAVLSPWLTGVAITAARGQSAPRFSELVQGGLTEYPRQLRLLLWGVLVYGVAMAVMGGLSHWASTRAEGLTLESAAQRGAMLATVIGAIALVLAHVSLESARAFLVVRPNDGGALRAWWRAVKLLVRRPLATLAVYLGVLVIGLVVAAVIAIVRVRVAPIGWSWVIVAALLTQLTVLALAWARVARLRALAHLAHDEAIRRYR